MAKKVKVKLNLSGVRKLLRSNEMANICEEIAKKEAQAMGKGYKTDRHKGLNRVNVSVYTDDPTVIKENLKNNTALKGMGANKNSGTTVQGYWRKGANGKKVFVKAYQRKK